MHYFSGKSIKCLLYLLVFSLAASGYGQECEWFPGGEESFYRYIEDRLTSNQLGRISRDPVNGESVSFEIFLNDSGYADSTHLGPCFNPELANNMRLILATLPRLNKGVNRGCPVGARRVFFVTIKKTDYGIQVDPAPLHANSYSYPSTHKFKWGIVVLAVVSICMVLFK
jgi:hypothetical protein